MRTESSIGVAGVDGPDNDVVLDEVDDSDNNDGVAGAGSSADASGITGVDGSNNDTGLADKDGSDNAVEWRGM